MTVEWFDLVQHEEEIVKIQSSIENWLAEWKKVGNGESYFSWYWVPR
jgi:hypothetical protein